MPGEENSCYDGFIDFVVMQKQTSLRQGGDVNGKQCGRGAKTC